jgi:UDP-N-acetylglucosamine diphosphorylase / glucose-1-phosphate thymidylyltransferase / UDP-N-acetylgalactosamine diphosphorylase / glucosamine-1-phosphate N-acetyltransferase / galactosamine-1-phosphate N-acetyltransferase
VSELRAGASLIRKRWERATSLASAGFISSPHLAFFEEGPAPPAVPLESEIPAGSILVNSRCVIPLGLKLDPFDLLMCQGMACAIRLARAMPVSQFADGTVDIGSIQTSLGGRRVEGRWMEEVWDFVSTLAEQLVEDIPHRAASLKLRTSLDAAVVGKGKVFVEEGADVRPNVVFDTTPGPILIRTGAVVAPFTHLVGPLVIGRDSEIMGDRVAASSIGAHSKVRGEFSSSIVLGYSNKGHAGFVGHSYLGRWVNLGALTTTSNLKNTYSPVQLWTPSGVKNTGQQFLGTFFGDHSKTAIGTMLNTGTVIGTGANVFGSAMPPKVVPPFAWGESEPYETFDVTKFLEVAERMMARREMELTENERKQLVEAHKRRWKS